MDPILDDNFPSLPGTFRQRGIATFVSRAHYGDDWDEFQKMWGSAQRPNIILLVRGVPVFDPRDPTQRLPTDPNDPDDYDDAMSTWKWTNNASLVIADYLWWPDGGRVPLSKIDWDKIAKSADWDDGLIGTKSGEMIPRHTIDGVVTAGQDPTALMQSLLTANRGFVCRSQGRVWVQSSQPVKPRLTITDKMVVGGFDFRRAQPKRDLLNQVRVRFVDPRQEWQSVDGPVVDRPDLRAEDGDKYDAAIDLSYTSDHRRAQRLAHAHLLDSRHGRAINMTVTLDALGLESGDVVRVWSEILPRMNGLYRIGEVGFSDNFTSLELALTEYAPEIERDWNPETDEQDFSLPDLDVS